jgi:hypothetical protein
VVHRKRKLHEISQAEVDVLNRSVALPSSTSSLEEHPSSKLVNRSTVVRQETQSEKFSVHSVHEASALNEVFEKKLTIEESSDRPEQLKQEPAPKREVLVKFGTGTKSIDDLKVSKAIIENLREEITELETNQGHTLELMRQTTSDQQEHRDVPDTYATILASLVAKASQANMEDIIVSSGDYNLSAKSFIDITSSLSFSEEALNAYIHLLSSTFDAQSLVLDTITTSMILSNVLTPERVREILHTKSVHLNNYHTVVFPVIDVAENGSVQLIIANIGERSVKVVRSESSQLGDQPAEQIAALLSYFVTADSSEAPEWAVKETVIASKEDASCILKLSDMIKESLSLELAPTR